MNELHWAQTFFVCFKVFKFFLTIDWFDDLNWYNWLVENSFYYSKNQSILLQAIKKPFSVRGFMMRKKCFVRKGLNFVNVRNFSTLPKNSLEMRKSENSWKIGKFGKFMKNRKNRKNREKSENSSKIRKLNMLKIKKN